MGRVLGEISLSSQRRIRLVAYGARLESVLGESPQGFESPILRQREYGLRKNFSLWTWPTFAGSLNYAFLDSLI